MKSICKRLRGGFTRWFLIALRHRLEFQMKRDFDPELSRKLDALNVLLDD